MVELPTLRGHVEAPEHRGLSDQQGSPSSADAGRLAHAERGREVDLADPRLLELNVVCQVLGDPLRRRLVRRLGGVGRLPGAEREDLAVALEDGVGLESRLGLEDRQHPFFGAPSDLVRLAFERVPSKSSVHPLSLPAAPSPRGPSTRGRRPHAHSLTYLVRSVAKTASRGDNDYVPAALTAQAAGPRDARRYGEARKCSRRVADSPAANSSSVRRASPAASSAPPSSPACSSETASAAAAGQIDGGCASSRAS